MKYTFAFDLDGTVTTKEVLPIIAKEVGIQKKMANLTRLTMDGEIPFDESFTRRVQMLKKIPISKVQKIVAAVPVSEQLVEFITKNQDRCYIVTGNLDVWIAKLLEKHRIKNCLSSKALYDEDKLLGIQQILRKQTIHRIIEGPVVAIGDGFNDMEMLAEASVSIAYGGIHAPARSLLEIAHYAMYDDTQLCQFLKRLL